MDNFKILMLSPITKTIIKYIHCHFLKKDNLKVLIIQKQTKNQRIQRIPLYPYFLKPRALVGMNALGKVVIILWTQALEPIYPAVNPLIVSFLNLFHQFRISIPRHTSQEVNQEYLEFTIDIVQVPTDQVEVSLSHCVSPYCNTTNPT